MKHAHGINIFKMLNTVFLESNIATILSSSGLHNLLNTLYCLQSFFETNITMFFSTCSICIEKVY